MKDVPKLYLARGGRNRRNARREAEENYQSLPSEVRAEPPLKQVWMLVAEDLDE